MTIRNIPSTRPNLWTKVDQQIEKESTKLEAVLAEQLASIARLGRTTLAQRFNGLSRPLYDHNDGTVIYRLAAISEWHADLDTSQLTNLVERHPGFERLKAICADPTVDVAIEATGSYSIFLPSIVASSYPAIKITLREPFKR